jgi:hypothetical protein
MFSFVQYSKTVEQMMQAWYAYTKEVLRQSGDLGFAREHFVQNVLASFLPKSVIVGSGEIIDGEGRRSSQQDIIVYRAGFPVITSLTPINTFLSEGVIATIEVKSRLSTGEPNLHSAFKNVKTVLSLEKRAEILSGTVQEIEKLKEVNRIRTHPTSGLSARRLRAPKRRLYQSQKLQWEGRASTPQRIPIFAVSAPPPEGYPAQHRRFLSDRQRHQGHNELRYRYVLQLQATASDAMA